MNRIALYRHYDSNFELLYVGITDVLSRRTSEHEAGADWFESVTRTTVEYFTSRDRALRGERLAIAMERPIHNVRRDTGPLPTLADGAWRSRLHDHLSINDLTMRGVSLTANCAAGYLHGVLFDGKDPTIDRFLRICAAAGADPIAILDLSTVTAITGAAS